MSTADVAAAVRCWLAVFGEEDRPDADEEPGAEQLAVLRKLLEEGQPPHVDFSVFGPHAHRLQRRMHLKGSCFASVGIIVPIELVGPPNIELWDQSFDLFTNAMVMRSCLDLGARTRYKKRIHALHVQLGASNWAFVYQVGVRAKQEQLMRLHLDVYIANERHKTNPSTKDHDMPSYDPARPWVSVWRRMLNDEAW